MKFETDKLTLTILPQVEVIFQCYIQNTKVKTEAGGILLGQIKDNNIYAVRASVPNVFDKRSRYYFERDKQIAQIIIDYEFTNSDGRTIYIGEWHTHPEDFPSPSPQDIKMIKNQFKSNKNIEPYLFLIIQGRTGIYAGVYDGQALQEMKVVTNV